MTTETKPPRKKSSNPLYVLSEKGQTVEGLEGEKKLTPTGLLAIVKQYLAMIMDGTSGFFSLALLKSLVEEWTKKAEEQVRFFFTLAEQSVRTFLGRYNII